MSFGFRHRGVRVAAAALVLLVPLAATSFNRAIKALGGKRWQLLHRLVYPIAGLGLLVTRSLFATASGDDVAS